MAILAFFVLVAVGLAVAAICVSFNGHGSGGGGSSSSNTPGKKIAVYSFSVGPIGQTGMMVTESGGFALGLGSVDGPLSQIGLNPSNELTAKQHMALVSPFNGLLKNLRVTFTANVIGPTVPVAAKVAVWTSPGASTTVFTETLLSAYQASVATPETFQMTDLTDEVAIGVGDLFVPWVSCIGNDGYTLDALQCTFELHYC